MSGTRTSLSLRPSQVCQRLLKYSGSLAVTDILLLDFINYGDAIAIEYIEKARASAKNFFENMDQEMKNAILPKSLQTETPASAAVPPSGPDLNTPQTNFVTYHLNNTTASAASPSQDDLPNGTANGLKQKASMTNGVSVKLKAMTNGSTTDDTKTNPGEIAIDVLQQFATDVIEPMGKTLMDKLGTDVDALIDLIKHGSIDKLWTLIADAVDTVISVIAQFVDGFLHFCEDIVNDLKDLLTQPIEVPFFTELYEFMCQLMGYDEEFTIINSISFLISIPLTTMMKIGGYGTIMDHNDIIGMDDPKFPQKLVSTVQGALQGSQVPAVRAQNKSVQSKALQTTHLLTENDDGFQPPEWLQYMSGAFGLCNGGAAIIYNALDFDFLVVNKDNDWKKKMKLSLAVARLIFAAPMPKANVDAQAYEVRWAAWFIGNGWRIFVNALKPGTVVPDNAITMPPFFENGGSLGVNVATEVMAVVCDARDDVSGLTWAGDVVSNTGGSFSSLGKMLEKDLGPPRVFGQDPPPLTPTQQAGLVMKYVATFVSLGGNVCSLVNAGGSFVNAAEGKNVWTGIL